MQYLRYNTDSQEVVFGIFVDSTDGNTQETGLTIANTDIRIWKAGATTLANKNSGGATHISNGIYYAVFDSTDTNTLGSGKVFIHISGSLYMVHEFCVLPQKVFDAMIAGSDNLEVDTIQVEGSDATDQINAACDAAISDAGITTTRMGYVDYLANATYGLSAIENLVDELESRLTAARAANLDELGSANIPADIDTLLTRLTAARGGYIDYLANGTYGLNALLAAINTRLAASGYTTPPTAASIADAVLNEALSEHTTSGTLGEQIASISTVGGGSTPAEIADAVWDEATNDHITAGSAGAAILAAGSAGDPWSTVLPGAYGEGTAGNIIGNMVTRVWNYTGIGTFITNIATAVWNFAARTITGAAAGTTIPGYPTVTIGNVTLADIYANAAALVYGDIAASPPPVHEVASLQSMILMRHRDCQLGFNYWFQRVQTTVNIVTGTTEYQWPANFKEYISLDTTNSFTYTATGFTLEDAPTADETVDFIYWALIPAPGTWDGAHTDSITNFLTWYVTYAAVGDMYLKRGEKTDAQAYYELAATAKLNTEREDFHRRQSVGVIF